MIVTETVTIVTSGGAGTSSGIGYTNNTINGMLLSAYVDYDSAAPATVDFVINKKINNTYVPVYTKNDYVTDSLVNPRAPVHSTVDGSVIAGQCTPVFLVGQLRINISQANDAQTFICVLEWDDGK